MGATYVDNIIIGFGKGGKTLAGKLAGLGQSVVLAEAEPTMYGGTCINIGCLPSKSLILSADQSQLTGAAHGDSAGDVFRAAIARKRRLTATLRDKNYHKLADNARVTVLTGHARFVGPRRVEIATADGARLFEADHVFINTGATPRIPDIDGITSTPGVYTSTGIMELDELPARLVIIGAGFIGLEFASMFADFGTSVTVLQHNDQFLPREDDDIVAAIRDGLERQGVKFLFNATTKRVSPADDGGVRLSVAVKGATSSDLLVADANPQPCDAQHDSPEARFCITTDAVLVAAGRTPNITDLGLEAAGVDTTERGAIKVDELLRTTADGVWALGDVNGGPQHTYISLDDSRVVISQLDGSSEPYTTAQRRNVPSSTFLHTPYSRVGLNEREAREAGYDVTITTMPVAAVPKAQVMQRPDGMMKAVIDASTGRILGAMLLSAESHEVINIVKLAMDFDADASVLRDMIFTHPTIAESLNDLFA